MKICWNGRKLESYTCPAARRPGRVQTSYGRKLRRRRIVRQARVRRGAIKEARLGVVRIGRYVLVHVRWIQSAERLARIRPRFGQVLRL